VPRLQRTYAAVGRTLRLAATTVPWRDNVSAAADSEASAEATRNPSQSSAGSESKLLRDVFCAEAAEEPRRLRQCRRDTHSPGLSDRSLCPADLEPRLGLRRCAAWLRVLPGFKLTFFLSSCHPESTNSRRYWGS
jgi:hypothetical protein